MSSTHISLRGVEVHNLKKVDLELPHRKLVVFCGVSGSGKTSMALDTLYAEGQRRYIESFSAYTRQFLERLEKPAAESIEGIPPALAVSRVSDNRSSRSTVGTATETTDYLRLLYSKIGEIRCHGCDQVIKKDTPQSISDFLLKLNGKGRMIFAFQLSVSDNDGLQLILQDLLGDGFVRLIVGNQTVNLSEQLTSLHQQIHENKDAVYVVVDRLSFDSLSAERLRETLETVLMYGDGTCNIFLESNEHNLAQTDKKSITIEIDQRKWERFVFNNILRCHDCDLNFLEPEPRLFNFNSPLGACPTCEGFGNVIDMDMELIVPDPKKSLAEGAIAPWNTPAYKHELEELLALADEYDLPTQIPFRELKPQHLKIIREGVPEKNFGGLKGFFQWLERRKYKMHLRVFLSRWRSFKLCQSCQGLRLRDEALAVRIQGKNIADVSNMKIRDALEFIENLELSDHDYTISRQVLSQVHSRLKYLNIVGLGYLSLDRTLRTVSGGEAQRVALTSTLGSSLVNMLYVLDEPSVGLHPSDIDRLADALVDLKNRGNSVILVEHDENMIRLADQVVEFGPGAGERGGEIVFHGSPNELLEDSSLTGDYLSGRREVVRFDRRRETSHGKVRVKGARGNNLKNIEVNFPLGVLCVVTGVSGAGKSSLVDQTLYPAMCRRKRKEGPKPLDCDDVFGDGQIDDIVLVDQSPIGRSPRSNPVTYIKAFDEIRSVFAATVGARTHNFTASHFSFNVKGGRCDSCDGDGHIAIDMQFLADVYMKCPDCKGKRYKKDVLEVAYRGKSIADVLDMTVREAFAFFRGQPKVQGKLQKLIDVGLDYLRLGQPANTLSAGEAQRLKLAGYLASSKRGRTLFLLDEPTTGLHFSDIVQLLDCFESLLQVGHSLIVVEHNVHMMMAADWMIDLGPGAADEGGQVVAEGTPEQLAENQNSVTGRFLAEALAARQELRTSGD